MKTLYVDCDGVLTDGKLYIATGDALVQEKPFKAFHVRDVTAIRTFRAQGWRVVIISADEGPHAQHFAKKVGAEFVYDRAKDQLEQPYFAIGDSVLDVDMLDRAERAFCPADADPLIWHRPGVRQLVTPGGGGVMAELAWELLR